MREQELLFTSRRESLRSKRESYSQVKSLLQREIKSMEAKQATIQRQLGLARQELEDVSKLVERGLAITSRRLGLEQTAAQFEAAKLDLDLAMLRAQQDISKTDRDAADLTSQRQDEILVELGMVRGKLATTAEKRITLERLIHDSEVVAPQRSSRIAELQQKPRLTIVRRAGGGEMQTIAVRDGDPVEPGDVVQVEMDIPPDVGLARR
jgi:DNA repair exonuclease SbcCD ATPase subunit